MKRIGYDSDSGRYYFRDRDGTVWQGPEGAEYGEMTRGDLPSLWTNILTYRLYIVVTDESRQFHDVNEDNVEAAVPTRSDGYQPLSTNSVSTVRAPSMSNATFSEGSMKHQPGPYATLFPFFLVIAVVLLLIWRLIVSPVLLNPGGGSLCPKGSKAYLVQPGDSCWEIAKVHGCSLDELKEANREVNCATLLPGTMICLPVQGIEAQGGRTPRL